MATKENHEERKRRLYETLTIAVIWLTTLAFLYIIFSKADAGLNQ